MSKSTDTENAEVSPAKKEQLFSPVFILIISISLCSFLMGQGANAGTSVFLEVTGEDTTLAGVGALVFSLGAAISRIVCGPVIDKRGRKTSMIAGSILMICGSVGPMLSNTGTLFVIWRLLQGIGFAAVTTAAATAAADVVAKSRLGEGIGYFGLGQSIAMSVSPALAIFLISTSNPTNFYIGLACCALLVLILASRCNYESHPLSLPATAEYRIRYEAKLSNNPMQNTGKELPLKDVAVSGPSKKQTDAPVKAFGTRSKLARYADNLFEPAALHGAIPMMFLVTAVGFTIFFIGVYGMKLGISNPSMFYTIAAISMIVVRLCSGKFMDKVFPIKIFGTAALSGLIAFVLMFACAQIGPGPIIEPLFYLAGTMYGICIGIGLPISQTTAVKLSSPSRWGAANALYMLCSDLSIGCSSFIWGIVNTTFGFEYSIVAVMVFVSISFIAALICYPKTRV